MAGEHITAAGSSNGIVAARPRVGRATALILAAGFALLATPVVMTDGWLARSDDTAVVEGKPAPVTVRVPLFSGYSDSGMTLAGGGIAIKRGQVAEAGHAGWVARIRDQAPASSTATFAYLAGLFLLGLLYSIQLRHSHTGRLLRTQVVTMAALIATAAIVQVLLLFTPISVLVIPIGTLAIVAALAVDLSVGLATGLAGAALLGFLVPFDPGTVTVLAVQACAPVLVLGGLGPKRRWRHSAAAGLFGGLCAATAYMVFHYLARRALPVAELDAPLQSAWVAAAAGGLVSGLLAIGLLPLYQFLMGEITRNRLIELEDLSTPLLKQIAEKAPGTWQHSLAMANMAEVAANEIGANGRLVRVGAYYHDLGKSLQPSYFIENLRASEPSPHDRLPPEVSCDAIFAHVTEGIRLARREALPERIIDFMHMHHGDGVLEYFWAKCEEQGNPKGLKAEAFRYPGVKPQTRETAILAICDAVEAASRTLKNPDDHAIRTLVQRIVYGKLHLGQLDESGLSVADLRRICNSLEATIRHAFHGRIEYPWQRQERLATEQPTPVERPAREMAVARSTTDRFSDEPRLDSLDVPRAAWSPRPSAPAVPLAIAPTEKVSSQELAAAPATTPDPAMATTAGLKSTDSIETLLINRAKLQPVVMESQPVPAPVPALGTPLPMPAVASEPVGAAVPATAPEGTSTPTSTSTSTSTSPESEAPAPLARAYSPRSLADRVDEALRATELAEAQPEPETEAEAAPATEAETAPAIESAAGTAPAPAAEPDIASATEAEPEPISLIRPSRQQRVAEWSTALDRAVTEAMPAVPGIDDDQPTRVRRLPPPPPGARRPRTTIPLMPDDEGIAEEAAGPDEGEPAGVARADSEDGALAPGMLVLGPPPATRAGTRSEDDVEPTKPGRRSGS